VLNIDPDCNNVIADWDSSGSWNLTVARAFLKLRLRASPFEARRMAGIDMALYSKRVKH